MSNNATSSLGGGGFFVDAAHFPWPLNTIVKKEEENFNSNFLLVSISFYDVFMDEKHPPC